MEREPIEVTRADRIYCLKVSSDYHSEVCEECKFYPNCDHMTQDDMTEVTIRDLQKLEKIEQIINSEVDPNICNNVGDVRKVQAIRQIVNNYDGSMPSMIKQFSEIQKVLEQE